MRKIKYFLQFIIIILFFFIFKILGIILASFLSGKIFQIVGPLFRTKELFNSNIKRAFPKIDEINLKLQTRLQLLQELWVEMVLQLLTRLVKLGQI